MKDQNCEHCRHWHKLNRSLAQQKAKTFDGQWAEDGQCRAMPPRVYLYQRQGLTLWPETKGNEFCGAWIPNEEWTKQNTQQTLTVAGGDCAPDPNCPSCRGTGEILGEPCPCTMPEDVRAMAAGNLADLGTHNDPSVPVETFATMKPIDDPYRDSEPACVANKRKETSEDAQ